MNNENAFSIAYQYETFLNRAFKSDKRITRASKQELLNLIQVEKGNRQSGVSTHENQVKDIKARLQKAIELYLKLPLTTYEKQSLNDLLPLIDSSRSSDDFFKVVKAGIEYTQSLVH